MATAARDEIVNLYNVLGVQRDATDAVILKAFKLIALKAHPDKDGGADYWMKNVNKAKATLLDPEERAKYDAELEAALRTGERFSEKIRKQLEEWSNEFVKFSFYDNYDNGQIYNDAYKLLKEDSQNFIKIDEEFQQKKKSLYETQYHKYLSEHKKENLDSQLRKLFIGFIHCFYFTDYVHLQSVNSYLFAPIPILGAGFAIWRSVQKLKEFVFDVFNVADKHFEAGRYTEALHLYINCRNGDTLNNRAYELFKNKNNNMAMQYFCASYFHFDRSCDTIAMILNIAVLQSGFVDKNLVDAIITATWTHGNIKRLHSLMIRLLYQDKMQNEVIGAYEVYLRCSDNCEPELNQPDIEKMFTENKELLNIARKQPIRDWLNKYCANEDGFLKKIVDQLDGYSSKILKELYEELTSGKNISQLEFRLQAGLLIFKGYYLEQEKEYKASLQAYQDAVILVPSVEVHSSVSSLLNINHIKAMIESLTDQLEVNDVHIPDSHLYQNKLSVYSNSNLSSSLKYEEAIKTGNHDNITSALLYIDLCMSAYDSTMICSNLILASTYFLKEMKQFQFVNKQKDDKKMEEYSTNRNTLAFMYALRNSIRELCDTTATNARSHENAITELHFVKFSFILSKLSNKLFRQALLASGQIKKTEFGDAKPVLDLKDKALIEMLSRSFSRLVKVMPFANFPMTLCTDFIYLNKVGIEFLEVYYNINSSDNPRSHVYKYELLELAWKCMPFVDGGPKFQQYREAALTSLLKLHPTWNMHQVSDLMKWDVLNRNNEGFLDSTRPWLNLPGQNYDSIDGVIINLDKGTFSLLMTPTPLRREGEAEDQMEYTGLFNMDDVKEVLKLGIKSSFFTLNQADFDMQSHPFQEMRFAPKNTFGSNFLKTQLHADLLLKYLSTGVEVSADFPFSFRSTADKLLNVLPEKLRDLVLPPSERKNGSKSGNAHRFWIECGELTYDVHEEDKLLIYLFGKCPMKVKTHLLKYNAEGELIDDDKEEESDALECDSDADDDDDEFLFQLEKKSSDSECNEDAEKKFARNMTVAYFKIGRYYRVLLRLRELHKMQAVYLILQNARNIFKEMDESVLIFANSIEALMKDQYSQIKEYNLSPFDLLDSTRRHLSKGYNILDRDNFGSLVYDYWKWGNTEEISLYIARSVKGIECSFSTAFDRYCGQFGIDFNNLEGNYEMNDPATEYECIWVPSAFCRNFPKRVYGGVLMNVKMKAHTVKGVNKGNRNAFKRCTILELNGNSLSLNGVRLKIKDRAKNIANKKFSGKSWEKFRKSSRNSRNGGHKVRTGGSGGGSDDSDINYGINVKPPRPFLWKINVKPLKEKISTITTRGAGYGGKAKIHNIGFKSKKEAYEAAKRASGGLEPILHHDSNSGWHYHAVDKNVISDVKSGKYFLELREKGEVSNKARHHFLKDDHKSESWQTGGVHYCFRRGD